MERENDEVVVGKLEPLDEPGSGEEDSADDTAEEERHIEPGINILTLNGVKVKDGDRDMNLEEEHVLLNTDGSLEIGEYDEAQTVVVEHGGQYIQSVDDGSGTVVQQGFDLTEHFIMTTDGENTIHYIESSDQIRLLTDEDDDQQVIMVTNIDDDDNVVEQVVEEDDMLMEQEGVADDTVEEDDSQQGDIYEYSEDVEIKRELADNDCEDMDGEIGEMEDVVEEMVDEEVDDPSDDPTGVRYAYMCSVCERVFDTESALRRHNNVCHCDAGENKHSDPLAFDVCLCCGEPSDTAHMSGEPSCTDCDVLFVPGTSYSTIERHKLLHHPDKNGFFKCHECKEDNRFRTSEGIMLHVRKRHPLAQTYTCKICSRDFKRKFHLERHVAQTGCHGVPRVQFQCKVCLRKFNRKDNLRDHLRAHAEGSLRKQKSFICQFCQKNFNTLALLQVHERTHTGEKPFACDLCPKRFPSSGAMKKHRRMHTGERPYACAICKKRFAAKETLNRHVRTHTGDRPHVCSYCGKSFIQAAQLRAHIFHHTGENAFACEICGRAFNRRVRLTTHMRFVHEGEEPIPCSEESCDRSFYRREDLARHMILHTGDKPFECQVCEKTFAAKSSLKLHMLTHRKEQPVSCDECGRAFIRQDCLMRHMRSKHRELLEDVMASAEKVRLQQQLMRLVTNTIKNEPDALTENHKQIWTEITLSDSIRELLGLLVDEGTLKRFGWPDAPVDRILESVIRRCGHSPEEDPEYDYISRMRENAKMLFTVVIDDQAVKSLMHTQSVDDVILHVLRLAKRDN